MAKSELEKYKAYVSDQLKQLTPILHKYTMGDFSESIPIPEEENEFTGLLKGLQHMVSDIREKIKDKDSVISKYKKTEKALKDSEYKFRSITENAVDYIFIKDKERKYIFVNQAMQDFLGMPKKKILGKTPQELFGPKQAQQIREFDDQVFSGETVNKIRNLKIKDRQFFLETIQTPLTTENKKVTSIMGIIRDVTDRKEAESALRKREEQYRTLFQASPAAITLLTLSGKIIDCNKSTEKLIGYSKDEIIGKSIQKLVTLKTEYEPVLKEKFKRLLKGVAEEPFEVEVIRKNGEKRWLLVFNAPYTVNGKIHGIQIIGEDITERKKAEAALTESEKRLNLAVKSANIGLWDQNFKKGIIIRNREWAEMLGYNVKDVDLNINTFYNLLHPDDKSTVKDLIHKHESGETDYFKVEHRMRTKKGNWKWIQNYGKIVKRDSQGNPLRALGVHIDINERKQAEEALRSAEREKEIILNSLVEHVVYHDKEMKIKWTNQPACESVDSTREELTGRYCYEIWHQRTELCPNCPVIKAMKTKKVQEAEKSTPDGRVWFIRGYPVQNEQGEIVGGIELTLDITEKKQSENALFESEERYRAVVENSQNGILIVGEDFKFIYVNDTLCSILGRKHEEIIDHDFREFLDKESKLLVEDRYLKRQRGEKIPHRYEFNIIRKDGEKRHVEISSTIVKDSQNRKKTIAQILDITDRKRAEKGLRESEAKYRSLIENSNDAIYLLYNRKFEIINKKFEELLGVTYKDVQKPDFDFMDLVKPEDHPLIKKRMDKVSRGENVVSRYQFTAVRPDGRELILEASVSYIPYKQGTATQGILRDMTERIRTENQIRKSLKEKEVLLKEIHHRVKNNLNVVTSLLNLQSAKLHTKKQAIEAFKESKDRIYVMAMVHEKLYQSGNFSEIDMKKYTIPLVRNLFTIYLPAAKITYDIKIDNVKININKAIPCGLLLNELITNALKHAFKGRSKGKIIITFHQLKQGQYEIMVKDNGVGLPEDINVKKVDSLGLKLISILTEQLEGKLSITAKNGSQFKIVFPVQYKQVISS
ncbi:MAG: PAS domain S-box protein [bacterium]